MAAGVLDEHLGEYKVELLTSHAARLMAGRGADFHPVGQADHPPGALDAYVKRLSAPTGLLGLMGTLKATAAQTLAVYERAHALLRHEAGAPR